MIIDVLVAIGSTKIPILQDKGFWAMAHEARTDWSMLLGSAFLLLVGAGAWSLDARLVPGTQDARERLAKLGSEPRHVEGDTFVARPRRNVPEREKPTPAQRRARRENIQKAQAARRGGG